MFYKKTLLTLLVFGLVLAGGIAVSSAAWSGNKAEFRENFDQEKFAEMIELKKAGDMESAKAIAEELGLPGKMKKFHNRRMHKLFHNGGKFIDENGDGVCDLADLPEKK